MRHPYVIAEIGSNWRKYDNMKRSFEAAKLQILQAKECGADAVKFQYFTCKELYGPEVEGTIFEEKFNRYALPKSMVPELYEIADDNALDFLCTAFSVEGYEYVDNYVPFHKIASPEISDTKLTEYLMSQPKRVFHSNGCTVGFELGRYIDIPMICASKYPATLYDYCLYPSVGGEWGVSDHTLTPALATVALWQGAQYFEKHVDFLEDFGQKTPDSVVSIGKAEFEQYVAKIKSFDYEEILAAKCEEGEKYLRKETKEGWFRPMPETADLSKKGALQ